MNGRGWADAVRRFLIFDPSSGAWRQEIEATIVGVDVFAQTLNAAGAGGAQNIAAELQIDVAQNGGYVILHTGDVIMDVQTGVALGVTRIDQARGVILLTCSQDLNAAGAIPASLPPVT